VVWVSLSDITSENLVGKNILAKSLMFGEHYTTCLFGNFKFNSFSGLLGYGRITYLPEYKKLIKFYKATGLG